MISDKKGFSPCYPVVGLVPHHNFSWMHGIRLLIKKIIIACFLISR